MADVTKEQCMQLMHETYIAVMNEINKQLGGGLSARWVKEAVNNNYQAIADRVCLRYASGKGDPGLRPELPPVPPLRNVILDAWEVGMAVLNRPHLPMPIEAMQEMKQAFQQAREDMLQLIAFREKSQSLLEQYKLVLKETEEVPVSR